MTCSTQCSYIIKKIFLYIKNDSLANCHVIRGIKYIITCCYWKITNAGVKRRTVLRADDYFPLNAQHVLFLAYIYIYVLQK